MNIEILHDDETGTDMLIDHKHFVCIGYYEGASHYLTRQGETIQVLYKNGSFHVTVVTA